MSSKIQFMRQFIIVRWENKDYEIYGHNYELLSPIYEVKNPKKNQNYEIRNQNDDKQNPIHEIRHNGEIKNKD